MIVIVIVVVLAIIAVVAVGIGLIIEHEEILHSFIVFELIAIVVVVIRR